MVPDERRSLILAAARELFSQRPYADVSVAGIAAAAGVSPPLIVFHFGSKRALYVAVIEAAAGAIREGLRSLPGPPSLGRLRAGVLFYAGYARSHQAGFLSLLRGGHEVALPEVAGIVEGLRAEVAGQIMADLAAGHPTAGHPTAGRSAAGTAHAPPSAPGGAATLLAVHGYLGYVDAAIVAWLSLPGPERDQVSPDVIAGLAVGAFTGGLAAVTGQPQAAGLGTPSPGAGLPSPGLGVSSAGPGMRLAGPGG